MLKNTLLLLSSFIFLCACTTKQDTVHEEKPPIPVLTTLVEIRDVPIYIESIGILKSAVSIDIRPQIGGLLEETFVSEGDSVQQNAPLFKIDSKLYLIKLQELHAQLSIDQANLRAIQKKLDRYKPLVKKNLVAQIDWDQLESEEEGAQALFKLRQAALKNVELDLERCVIKSPIEGRMGKIDIHPGELIDSHSKVLVTICKLNPLVAEFTVTEQELAKVSASDLKAEIQLLCSQLKEDITTIPVKITFLDNYFDAKTGLLLVRGTVENPYYLLRPGQNVKIKIPVSIQSNMKLIPQKAVRYNEHGPYVYIVQSDQTVAIRQLVLGGDSACQVIVLQGLDASDSIITDGHLRLSAGAKVEVKS